ncbi:MAG: hypothetical protein EBS93_06145, partial [Chitinophagia bacterium]|nr:hypothetical protein [Chitinophagia bacterium]
YDHDFLKIHGVNQFYEKSIRGTPVRPGLERPIDPETNNTRDLGSNNLYWRNAYLGNLFNSGTLITIQSGTNIPALRITGSAITGASGISGYNYTGLYISIADNFITAPNRLVDIRGGANGLLQKFTIVIISTSLTLKNPF